MKKVIYTILSITLLTACKKESSVQDNKNTISTSTENTIKDIEGNTYKTVKIGTQTWMAENLKVSKYNNGISLPNITDSAAWSKKTIGAYCNYDNDTFIGEIYGKLYNWYTIASNNICPTGWHVPSQKDWQKLIHNLGGDSTIASFTTNWQNAMDTIVYNKLRETGSTHWFSEYFQYYNKDATNTSGFTALPAGYKIDSYEGLNYATIWWSSTIENGQINPPIIDIEEKRLFFDSEPINSYKNAGFSIRCIKD
jgi:uncharacterized protein (TIGR02145 family)